jgi:hypothetical protein
VLAIAANTGKGPNVMLCVPNLANSCWGKNAKNNANSRKNENNKKNLLIF